MSDKETKATDELISIIAGMDDAEKVSFIEQVNERSVAFTAH
jgi:hypothetical protein